MVPYLKHAFFGALCLAAIVAHRVDLLIMAAFAWAVIVALLFLSRHGMAIDDPESIPMRELSRADRQILCIISLILAAAGVYVGYRQRDLFEAMGAFLLFGLGGGLFTFSERSGSRMILMRRYRRLRKARELAKTSSIRQI